MILFHYVAEITGPSPEAVLENYVTRRKPSALAKSSWGYSNSDLVRLVREAFSNAAVRVLETRYVDAVCSGGSGAISCGADTKCFAAVKTTSTGDKNYMECRSNATADFVFMNSDRHDMYAVLTVDDFCNALLNPDVDTTTGNVDDYCSFVTYSLTKTYRDETKNCSNVTKGNFDAGQNRRFYQAPGASGEIQLH